MKTIFLAGLLTLSGTTYAAGDVEIYSCAPTKLLPPKGERIAQTQLPPILVTPFSIEETGIEFAGGGRAEIDIGVSLAGAAVTTSAGFPWNESGFASPLPSGNKLNASASGLSVTVSDNGTKGWGPGLAATIQCKPVQMPYVYVDSEDLANRYPPFTPASFEKIRDNGYLDDDFQHTVARSCLLGSAERAVRDLETTPLFTAKRGNLRAVNDDQDLIWTEDVQVDCLDWVTTDDPEDDYCAKPVILTDAKIVTVSQCK